MRKRGGKSDFERCCSQNDFTLIFPCTGMLRRIDPDSRPSSPLHDGSLGTTQQVQANSHGPATVQAPSTPNTCHPQRNPVMLPRSIVGGTDLDLGPSVPLSSFPSGLHRSSPVLLLPPLPPPDRSLCQWPAFSALDARYTRVILSSEVGKGGNGSPALLPPPSSIAELVSFNPTARRIASPPRMRTLEALSSSSTVAYMQPGANSGLLSDQSDWVYLAYANAEEAERLLPRQLADMIIRIPYPHKPGTAMAYPGIPEQYLDPNCQVSFNISAQHAGQVVQDLFNADLVRNGLLQYIFMPGGSLMVPCPHITLRRCTSKILWYGTLPRYGVFRTGGKRPCIDTYLTERL